ncbi:tegument phosphoprotein UL83 [Cynomolgus macaque cytomegalovirus strain Ottawa]|uniref:Tegument phosphoprotein UL83 n=1 Tax=macacine betaherpesvirus 8 TaxID=2560567 RepID=G8H1B8_9BETA|nr:tegument phosphoprotein UL83 [Cynomolgus macaque cytomegalovirus strain Ottawa]AEQ32192.1 tegument phosphoprotein UL83 [Cynomolgus macaque cytomegalovirus strain Ottawa]
MALSQRYRLDYVSELGPIAGKVIQSVFDEAREPVKPHETKIVKTGLRVQVHRPSIIFLTQFARNLKPDPRYEHNTLQIKHTTFEDQELKDVYLHVHNPTDKPITPADEPMSFFLYALPLRHLVLADLTLHPGGTYNPELPTYDAAVQAFAQGYHTRFNAYHLQWTQRYNRWMPHGVHHTASFYVNTSPMPLWSINVANELVCSLRNTHVRKVQLVDKVKGLVRIFLESFQEETPDDKVFVHLAWEQSNGVITMNRNPKPFLTPQQRNGYTILNPKRLHLKPREHANVMIDTYFESDKYIGFICPKSVPGCSISCNPIMPTQCIFIEIRSLHDSVYIEAFQAIASLHFFDRSLFFTYKKTDHSIFKDQYRVTTSFEYHQGKGVPIVQDSSEDDDSSSSESEDMDVFEVASTTPHAGTSSSSSASKKREKLYKPLVQRKRFTEDDGARKSSSDDDNDDFFPTLFWGVWQFGVRASELTPMIASVCGDQLPHQEFSWEGDDDLRIFSGLSGSWHMYQTPKRRHYSPSEQLPSTSGESVSKRPCE